MYGRKANNIFIRQTGLAACFFAALATGCADDASDMLEGPGGKADSTAVNDELARITADGELSADDVTALFAAAGNNVSTAEMLAIRDAIEATRYEVTPDATDRAFELAYTANLLDHEVSYLSDADNGTYAETPMPAAVRELVARARLNGALAYDVREEDSDGETKWTPYPSTTPPTDNMTFQYTQITPQVLAADIADTDLEYQAIVGVEKIKECQPSDPTDCFEYDQVKYEDRVGGTGNVLAQYDEAHHPNIFARGTQGQKWANNCAILSDGSLHCLPASRRSVQQDLILTNPHLSRCNDFAGFETACKSYLYNGHIDVRDGVVVGVEVSGRVAKYIGRGSVNMIDPIALLEAWGFEMAPGLRVVYGNTEDGVPHRDDARGVLTNM